MRTCLLLIPIMMFLQYHHVAVLSSYNASATTHLSPHMQKLALFQFKLSMAINSSASESCISYGSIFPYPKTKNWSMNSDYCTWDGITCDQMTGDVIGLDLSCSQIVGAIPPNSTLFQLSLLQIIAFNFNDIHGVLPEEIFHLPNLNLLSLLFNPHLSVILPKTKWGSTSTLQGFYLGQTTLIGEVPDSIGYLKSLTTLVIWNCSLSGPFPRSIVNLSQLTQLNLGLNNLIGQIPDSLANLQNLIQLDLNHNNFSGWIPRSIGNLTQLLLLDLRSNSFSGRIPDSLGTLQNLAFLYLSDNNFSGRIPRSIGNLTQLLQLDLHSNSFSGQIPDSLGTLQNLTFLDLSDNNLIGPFPPFIANLRQLINLDLSDNSLTGPLPSNLTAICLPKLTFLSLGNNFLNGTIPSGLFDLPSLQYLLIDSNGFTGQLYEFDSVKSSLETVSCRNNLLDGTIPKSFSELVNLTSLDLSSNKFSGVLNVKKFPPLKIPQWFGLTGRSSYLNLSHNNLTGGLEHLPWNNLNYLDLQFNMFNGSLPASICNSSSLDILNLSHNNLSGLLPTCPRNLGYSLSVLDLRMNSIRGSLPSTLSNFRKLRSLNLHGNKLEGTIPLSFAEFVYLEVLDLGSNQIHDTFPHCLESLPSLHVLVLKSNKFHGFINNNSNIDHPFTNLRIIDLSYNEFSGLLPAKLIKNFNAMMNGDVNKIELAYMGDSSYSDSISVVIKGVELEFVRILTVFTTIDLSRNKFEGEIPEYIGNLKSLRYLNLSHNHLTGQIPSLIGKLSMLESLDLSFNGLVGVIPQELTSIYSLSRLNLSKNNLRGHIPEGAHFNTFENDSYAGNLGLCGRPLSKKCITETKAEDEINEDEGDGDGFFFSGFTWEAMVIGYGCGVSVGFVVGYMMFMAGKPKWFTGIIARELGLKVRRMEIRHR